MDAGADAKSAIKKQKDMDERTNTSKDTIREAADAKMVNEAFEELLKSYLSSPHRKKVDLITKAFNFARQAHKGVRRLSGEPYIMHPLAVALIASSEMGLGSTSICSALSTTWWKTPTTRWRILRPFSERR